LPSRYQLEARRYIDSGVAGVVDGLGGDADRRGRGEEPAHEVSPLLLPPAGIGPRFFLLTTFERASTTRGAWRRPLA
jgi:hypothetical protein